MNYSDLAPNANSAAKREDTNTMDFIDKMLKDGTLTKKKNGSGTFGFSEVNHRDKEDEEEPINLEAIQNMKVSLPEYEGI